MTVIIPHHKTKDEVVARLDQAADDLFAKGVGSSVTLADTQKSWDGSTMNFALKAKMGFISVPLSGTVAVDDTNVTVECELPSMVKNFVGEAKAQAGIEKELTKLIA